MAGVGNPLTNKDDFDYIQGYSPYDNVEAKSYPHILALAGLTDRASPIGNGEVDRETPFSPTPAVICAPENEHGRGPAAPLAASTD